MRSRVFFAFLIQKLMERLINITIPKLSKTACFFLIVPCFPNFPILIKLIFNNLIAPINTPSILLSFLVRLVIHVFLYQILHFQKRYFILGRNGFRNLLFQTFVDFFLEIHNLCNFPLRLVLKSCLFGFCTPIFNIEDLLFFGV